MQAARKNYKGSPNYIGLTVAFNTPNIGTANMVQVGTLPAGCVVFPAIIAVTEAFNAATTNVLIIGTSADDDAYVQAGDVDEATVGGYYITRSAGFVPTVDTPVYVKFTETGTAATTGAAKIIIPYAPFAA